MRQFHCTLAPVWSPELADSGSTTSPRSPSVVDLNTFAIRTFLTPRRPADAFHVFWRNSCGVKMLIGSARLGGNPVRAMNSSTAFFLATGSGNCLENKVSRYPAVLVVDGIRNCERVVVTLWW